MLPEDHEARLRCYRNALRNWRYEGFVVPKKRAIEQWLKKELPDYKWQDIAGELHRHVENGGEIDEQVERRAEYVQYEFHYDLRVRFGARYLYFETVLKCRNSDDPDSPMIVVVSVHDV
jgi:hypothetical protein